ncbi:MAG: helix-turn-helix domain containing protein [Candidatus Obscuribacterales bacterium]|nr:helix-turn-helix domain containing protein [Candidatus Obscuribacterales bacterium]
MGRREDKKLATRNLILDAAATLFPRMGYEQTSVDDIVKEADVVKGTFYYHFTSKEEVLMALRRSALCSSDFEKSLEVGTSPLRVLAELLMEDARWTQDNRALAEVFFTRVFAKLTHEEQPSNGDDADVDVVELSADGNGPDDKSEKSEKSEHNAAKNTRQGPPASIVRLVRAAQDASELRRDQSAEDLAEVILGSFVHAQLTWLIAKSNDSLIERVERWLEIVLQGCAHECKQDLVRS